VVFVVSVVGVPVLVVVGPVVVVALVVVVPLPEPSRLRMAEYALLGLKFESKRSGLLLERQLAEDVVSFAWKSGESNSYLYLSLTPQEVIPIQLSKSRHA
jgi:hypothetical protein